MNNSPDDEGGTPIIRKRPQIVNQPQMNQGQAMNQGPEMMYQQPPMNQGPEMMYPGKLLSKSSFRPGMPSFTAGIKQAILVSIIFVLLNSKMIWKQIIKFPFMGETDPSIVALLVNSILAGLIFYIVTKYLKN